MLFELKPTIESLTATGMQVMIFEKDSLVPAIHHVVEFRGDDLEPNTLESRISTNIDRTCETNVRLFSRFIAHFAYRNLNWLELLQIKLMRTSF